MKFELVSNNKPKGSQPKAIKELVEGLKKNYKAQTLLGVTGSGKTFSMANVIAKTNRPALVLAHNKTLAAQLFSEFKELFPKNRVEYFVSYYDYYQPESYIPQKDQYIEKDAQINAKIEQMRLSTTASILSRNDVIIVSSVSCIYGLGSPENFKDMGVSIEKNTQVKREIFLKSLIDIQYERNDTELMPGRFKVNGEIIDIIPGYSNNIIRVEFFGDDIERIIELEKTSNKILNNFENFYLFPARHFVIPEEKKDSAIKSIQEELEETLPNLEMLEAHRLKKRTMYDIEMIQETGYCKGIENYSRHFDNRKQGQPPFTLMDFMPKDDESHQTIPQLNGMYKGDYSRKKSLIDYGFRLPSAFDNRPLKFNEFEKFMRSVIFVSATPGKYEKDKSSQIVEQIIRPTGLVDPIVTIRSIKNQMNDIKHEIEKSIKKQNRVLLTTLTKKLAEELTDYLAESNIKARYLHSEIDTLERSEIIRELRLGKFDVLVGINLLREGIDIPEVGFIGILDADKEGFLRDTKSLIQIIGRAARNIDSQVVLYANKITESMKNAIDETNRRRNIQIQYNKDNKITPTKIIKPIKEKEVEIKDIKHIPKKEIPNLIIELQDEMNKAAEDLNFERAIELRDRINRLKKEQIK